MKKLPLVVALAVAAAVLLGLVLLGLRPSSPPPPPSGTVAPVFGKPSPLQRPGVQLRAPMQRPTQ